MLIHEFSEFVTNLHLHFGKAMMATTEKEREQFKAQLKSWFAPVKDLPSEALPYITRCICSECDYFPRNPSKAVLTYWRKWREEHPQRCAPVESEAVDFSSGGTCTECGGSGKLYVVRQNVSKLTGDLMFVRHARTGEKIPSLNQTVFGCAKCRVMAGQLQLLTVDELLAAGWELDEPGNRFEGGGQGSGAGAEYVRKAFGRAV